MVKIYVKGKIIQIMIKNEVGFISAEFSVCVLGSLSCCDSDVV